MRTILSFFLLLSLLFAACKGRNTEPAAGPGNDSLAWLRKSLQQYPDSLAIRAELSRWLETHQGPDSAMGPIREGIGRDSSNPYFYNRLAILSLTKSDTAAAIRYLLTSLNRKPEQTDVHLELGFLYAAQKNKGALVVADFLLSQAQEPLLQSQARYMKGIYYANMDMRKEALEMFNEIIVNDYTFLDAYIEKGILLYNDKQYAEALKSFDKAMVISNTHAEAYLWTAKTLEAMGRKAEALDFYKKTAGLDAAIKEAEEGVKRLSQ